MPDYEIKHSTAAGRATIPTRLAPGHLGSTSDEHELHVGNPATPFGIPVTHPQSPKSGLDVRRLFTVASQGQQDTYTDVGAVARDASGMVLSPRPSGSAGTDVVTTGYILPYELADGGTITIEATGTYKCGSITPRILANLKIGGAYVRPQYEASDPVHGTNPSRGLDVSFITGAATDTRAFEWSSPTLGLNALGGYSALHHAAANLAPGEFQWRLTMKVHALGRWAKYQRFNDVGTGAAATRDRNCWVEATLEWGALSYNAGGRMGEPFAFYNPTASRNLVYQATLPAGTVRGCVYSFLGQQWLCHAASATTALNTAADPDEIDPAIWTLMLAEEAPGMGVHWREFFVPLVSRATISGYSTVDWTAGNEIQLELGGPQQVDLGTSFAAYSATQAYIAEGAGITPNPADGTVWAAKTTMYVNTFPHFEGGLSDVTGVTPSFTEAPDAATTKRHRCWRQLPATLRDEMRMQHVHGYLYGRRNGVAERRV